MTIQNYENLVEGMVNHIKEEEIDNVAYFLNDLKFDVLELLYETDNDLQVVLRGIKIEPFSKQKLSENLAVSSDEVSDDQVADVLDTEDILEIVEGVISKIKKDNKKVISSDEIVEYTAEFLEENDYSLALQGYEKVNKREDRKNED